MPTSFILDLAQFRGDVHRIAREDPPRAFALDGEDFRLLAPVRFEADVRKDREKVRLTGRVVTTMEVDCSRCLEPFPVPVDTAFDLLFLPASSDSAGGEHEIDDEDVGVSYYRDDVIDLADVMREQFLLALPMKPLCREECAGLCTVCGVNRNTTACTCEVAWVDPRMAALAKLRPS